MAAFELGLLYLRGQGVPENSKRAAELFKQSADQGYPAAQYNLALMHLDGRDAAPSLAEAARLMKAAADAGLAEAQYDYGTMLIQGAGVTPNTAEGRGKISLAAEQGLLEAQVDYATLLYLGEGSPATSMAPWGGTAGPPTPAILWRRTATPSCWRWARASISISSRPPCGEALARRQGLNDKQLDDLLVGMP